MLLTMVAISEHIENHDNPDRLYAHGNYIDEVLTMNDGTNDYYYAHNHLFSVCALLEADGDIAERYEYNAYGKLTHLDPDFTAWSGTEAGNPYYFTGRRLDALDSGDLAIMYYRNRYYSPETGRFLTHDLLGYIDGMSLYAAVDSDPINKLDSLGLASSGKKKCQGLVNNAVKKQQKLIDLLKKNKCKIPKIKCKYCKWSHRDSGGYYQPKFFFFGNTITMCYNNINSQQGYDTILKHEMFHAVQACNKEKENNRCETSVCKEIEAYYNANCAHIGDPALRKQCVKRGVDYSSSFHCKKMFGLGSVDQARIDKILERYMINVKYVFVNNRFFILILIACLMLGGCVDSEKENKSLESGNAEQDFAVLELMFNDGSVTLTNKEVSLFRDYIGRVKTRHIGGSGTVSPSPHPRLTYRLKIYISRDQNIYYFLDDGSIIDAKVSSDLKQKIAGLIASVASRSE